MARGQIDVNIRLDRQEKKILKMREDLEKAQEEYEELVREKEEKEKEALYKAYKKGKRSLQEILDFIKGKADL
jgi:dsDNA-specific endonuclease/ATPase MutS2